MEAKLLLQREFSLTFWTTQGRSDGPKAGTSGASEAARAKQTP